MNATIPNSSPSEAPLRPYATNVRGTLLALPQTVFRTFKEGGAAARVLDGRLQGDPIQKGAFGIILMYLLQFERSHVFGAHTVSRLCPTLHPAEVLRIVEDLEAHGHFHAVHFEDGSAGFKLTELPLRPAAGSILAPSPAGARSHPDGWLTSDVTVEDMIATYPEAYGGKEKMLMAEFPILNPKR